MNTIQSYLRAHSLQLFVAVLICAGLAFGMIDPAAALVGGIMLDTAPVDMKALHEATQRAFEAMKGENTGLKARVLDLEQKVAHKPGGNDIGDGGGDGGVSAIVAAIMENPQFLEMKAGRLKSCIIPIERKTLITTPALVTGAPLVAPQRLPGVVYPNQQRLYVRNLLPQAPTTAPAIEYTEEISYDDQAAPQWDAASPGPNTEGVIKAESGLLFAQRTARVITVAHWIPASVQILDDAPQLEAYLGSRLIYGLRLKEENMLLNSTGTGGELLGLIAQARAFNRGGTGDTKLDTLRKAVTQLALANAIASGIILHPTDWETIELTKNSLGDYLEVTLTDASGNPVAWRVPVIASNSMAAGTWLAGDFNTAAQLWDRQQATVEISREHADFFLRNLCAIRCECRETLTVYRPASLVTGSF